MECAPEVDQRPASMQPTNNSPLVPGGWRPQIIHQHFDSTHSWMQNAPDFVRRDAMMPSIQGYGIYPAVAHSPVPMQPVNALPIPTGSGGYQLIQHRGGSALYEFQNTGLMQQHAMKPSVPGYGIVPAVTHRPVPMQPADAFRIRPCMGECQLMQHGDGSALYEIQNTGLMQPHAMNPSVFHQGASKQFSLQDDPFASPPNFQPTQYWQQNQGFLAQPGQKAHMGYNNALDMPSQQPQGMKGIKRSIVRMEDPTSGEDLTESIIRDSAIDAPVNSEVTNPGSPSTSQHIRDQAPRDFAAKLKREEKNLKKGLIILQERDQTLSSTNSNIDGLIEDNYQVKMDHHDFMRKKLRRELKAHLIKPYLEKRNHSHATEDASLREETKKKVILLFVNSNDERLERLRKKLEKQRQKPTELHQEDNSALDKTILLSQQESDEAREGCRQKVSELPREVSDGSRNFSSKSEEAKMNLAEMQRKTDQELNKVKFESASIRETHKKELEPLEKEKLKEEHLNETVNEACPVTPKRYQKCHLMRAATQSSVSWKREKVEKLIQLCSELRQEYNSAALDKTILLNQQESDEAREGCQQKVSELPREVSDGSRNLSSKFEEAKMNLAEMQRKTDQELNKVKPESASIRETHKKELEPLEKEKLKEEHLKKTVKEACPVTPKQYKKCHLRRAATVSSVSWKSISFKDLLSCVMLLSSLLPSSSASNTVECMPVQYAPLTGRAVVRCDGLGDFPLIYWFNDIEDDATAFIQKENGEVTGSGYRAGDYNIDNEGSLVIYNVTLRDDRTFQVGVLDSDLIESSDDITLVVYVESAEPLPVIPECSGQSTCILKGESDRVISCIHGQSRPAMEVSWFLRVGREDQPLNATVNQMVSADSVTVTTSAQLAINKIPIDANMNQLLVLVCKSNQSVPGVKGTERKILLDNSVDDPFTNAENLDPVHAFERQEDFKIKCQSEIDTTNNVVLWMYKSLNSEDFENILYSAYGEVAFTTKGEAAFNITNDGALVIKEVDRQHEGYYACVSSLAVTFVNNLEVIVLPKPPRILVQGCEPFQLCHLSAREAETITCTVNGVRPQVDLSIVTYSTNVAVTKTTVSSYKEDGLFYTTVEGHVDVSKVTCEENNVTVICQARGTAAYGFMSDAYIIVPVDGDDCAETSTDLLNPDDDGSGNTLLVKVGITFLVVVVVVVVVIIIALSGFMIWCCKVARGQWFPHHEINSQETDIEISKFSNGD